MQKTSKVTKISQSVDQNGNPKIYNGQYGMMYFHWVEFENGDKGEYMHKNQDQNKFTLGQPADYEIVPNDNPQFPSKIKPVQSQNGQGFKGGRSADPKSFAASYAKDILVAYINNGKQIKKEWFSEWADFIHAWMDGKDAKPPVIPEAQQEEPTDDLPF